VTTGVADRQRPPTPRRFQTTRRSTEAASARPVRLARILSTGKKRNDFALSYSLLLESALDRAVAVAVAAEEIADRPCFVTMIDTRDAAVWIFSSQIARASFCDFSLSSMTPYLRMHSDLAFVRRQSPRVLGTLKRRFMVFKT
jgi:hypothetical protein